MMWCESCNQAVRPQDKTETIYHSEVDTRRFEVQHFPVCPRCGEELEYNAVRCGCGEWMQEHDKSCAVCCDAIETALKDVLAHLKEAGWRSIGDALDAMVDVIDGLSGLAWKEQIEEEEWNSEG